ncbi:MAG: DUF1549 domain-containing protein, partial [bacterium]|nr:DUF1549 domain-containing protein [bacterium]
MHRGALALSLLILAFPLFSAGDAKVDFNRDVRPILSDRCFACHGPDENTRMVDLRLDTREGAFADRGGYRVIVPGGPSGSRLYQRIGHEQAALRMPPRGSAEPLTAEEIETIRRWIDQGAEWDSHWAYRKPAPGSPPLVTNESWPKNPIDHYVLARLEQEVLEPSPEPGRETLIRRATLDLTGLPPTLEEVDAFLADRSPNAYEKVIDRLLASPRYGERMAMDWLDLARYADTHGYHIDSHRDMWHWRDWVVRAFNRNMPFDQFTVEQLAGDLLPDPTPDQLVATGFNRNHMINYEGGAIPEEYQVEYVVDRVEATSTVWMGMTMGCARCHDHKYDPITQKDFYRMFAFFNTVDEVGLDGRRGNAKPMLPLPSPAQHEQRKSLVAEISALEKAFPEADADSLFAEWRKTRLRTLAPPSPKGLESHYEMEGSTKDTAAGHRNGKKVRGEVTYNRGKVGKAAVFSGETHFAFDGAGEFDRNDRFAIALWVRTSGKKAAPVIEKIDRSDSRRGYQLL